MDTEIKKTWIFNLVGFNKSLKIVSSKNGNTKIPKKIIFVETPPNLLVIPVKFIKTPNGALINIATSIYNK